MAYIPATYAAILADALERPLVRGQGARWEATAPHVFRAAVRLQASGVSFIGNEIKEEFGPESRDIVWRAAGNYGPYRGEEARRRVAVSLASLVSWPWAAAVTRVLVCPCELTFRRDYDQE